MSRQETPTQNQTTGAHRKHRAPAGRAARQEAVPKDVPTGGEPRTEGSRAARRDTSRADAPRKAGRKDARKDSRTDSRKEAGPRTAQHGGGNRRRPHGTLPMQPPSHYEPYLDGLFTYCLSILCEHDAAAAALGEVLALAERQRGHLRDPRQRRPWLYALARWTCLRRLAAGPPDMPSTSAAVAEQRNAQLAALAWPEAAGTTPEQREALELAVRHQLPPVEVAAVLGIDADTARGLLARAACEVERTRTALSVVDTGHCAALAQLAGETKVLLGTALRTELVRHVDDCPVCRRTAERVVASGPWPGAAGAGATAVLALIEAPRSAAYAALLHAMDAGAGRSRDATPRFDRRGFPMDLKDRAARRAQIRHRAVTSTVVAAVVAAPVLALWAAYHGSPLGGDAPGSRTAASEPDGPGDVYQEAGSSRRADGPKHTGGTDTPSPVLTTTVSTDPTASGSPTSPGGGTLTVAATGTTVTLTAGGSAPVHWSATSDAYWIRLSATSGDLQPGESVILRLSVVRSLEPAGSWTARIAFSPAHATVILRGSSTRSVPPPASSAPTDDPTDTPTSPPTTAPPTTPPPTTDPPTTPPPTTDPPTTPPPTTTPPTTPTESQSPTPTE
ncbi:BACON domain-containing protein [Actinacidiphila alni]|uniref:BACON domain-containing protein n=1 Tax=Actinacidiphila alni TaxID=380248 RepID=UPI00345212A2